MILHICEKITFEKMRMYCFVLLFFITERLLNVSSKFGQHSVDQKETCLLNEPDNNIKFIHSQHIY